MLIVSAKVGPFKSINESVDVEIDEAVTVFVGMNEAGKTIFLQALEKSNDVMALASFKPVDDYPRKDLSSYLRVHATKPATVTELTYRLNSSEIDQINADLRTGIPGDFEFSVTHKYDNTLAIGIAVSESPVLASLSADVSISADARAKLKEASGIRAIPALLKSISLTEEDKAFLAAIEARIAAAPAKWMSVAGNEVWRWLEPRIPKFLYFGDYDLLPSKLNLAELAQRVEEAKSNPQRLEPKHRGILALLRMADISVADFTKSGGYEPLKAKIEAVSISLTDQIMEFWKQNEDLEVEVDIAADPHDEAPFNNGPNLYLRIKNRRHRGVSTPFQQRSRGFIWFFSFLVWFDSVQHQIDPTGKSLDRKIILLLDEPGLALHALAQADFLRYIDELATRHQVLYTTHSPFMVHSDRLHQVRVVEDQEKIGTVISDNVSSSDPRTIFPLQAALGWSIAQNLFISERNLLVEGPSELIYLKAVSSMLELLARSGLRDDVTIVPVGGLDKVVTFIALLGASGLKLAVLHDYRGAPEQKLVDLVKHKIISPKAILNASQFRDLAKLGVSGAATDIEDLFECGLYLDLFNETFSTQLAGKKIAESDLPPGDRVVDRIERLLEAQGIKVRPSGGFNHYAVASHFVSHLPSALSPATLSRFEALFVAVNRLF